MSRCIEALKNYNKNKEGDRFWRFITTESDLVMDSIHRILFGDITNKRYEIITLKELELSIKYYREFLDIFSVDVKQKLNEKFEELLRKATQEKVQRVLFKIY